MKKMVYALFAGMLLLSLCSCKRWDTEDAQSKERRGAEVLDSMDMLESGHCYVMHDGKFYSPVLYDASFEKKNDGLYSRSRTAWFSEEEFTDIPTLYKGDSLIYYADAENFSEKFYFERFEYVGYSVGICNLKETESGRYKLTASPGNKDVDPDSDAARLLSLNEDVIIDSIGQAELRSGNISPGGIILGLQKDKFYQTEVYVGSELRLGTMKADVICLNSMSGESIGNYEFLRSKILEIRIPENYHSGYYMVGGTGIFRYVTDTSYDSSTDFNIPNERVKTVKVEYTEQEFKGENNAEKQITFVVTKESEIEIEVAFEENPAAEYRVENPVVKVTGYGFSKNIKQSDGRYFSRLTLSTGEFTLIISGIDARAYKYEVRAVIDSEDEEDG